MRIGVFGGSFDPIHFGHLILAEQCREQAKLDEVWFVPAAIAPHKRVGPTATDNQRIEMVELAIAGHAFFRAKDLELVRGGTSYTIDTLEQLVASNPEDERFLIIGGDSLAQLASWRKPKQICELAIPLVYFRPGSPQDLGALAPLVSSQRLEKIRDFSIDSRMIDISSTDIRARVATGRSIRYLLPRPVEMLIHQQQMYQER